MKFYLGILLMLFLFSCQDIKEVKKPENLISEDKMVDVLTDLSVLNSAKNFNKFLLEGTGIRPNEYLYEKHEIDSLQLAKSTEYYAKNYDMLDRIYSRVKVNLEKMKGNLEIVRAEEERIEDSIRMADTLIKPNDSIKDVNLVKSRFTDSLGRSPIIRLPVTDSI